MRRGNETNLNTILIALLDYQISTIPKTKRNRDREQKLRVDNPIMVRATKLTSTEQSIILALAEQKLRIREISEKVSRSRALVHRVLLRGEVSAKSSKPGSFRKISCATVRVMVRRARLGQFSARQLRDMYCPHVTVRRVQQIFTETPNLAYLRMQRAPPLSSIHRQRRLDFAERHSRRGNAHWRRLVFIDEKRLSLDGPDGHASYWADLHVRRRWFSTHQNGGGSIMIWAAISYRGKSELAFIDKSMNAQEYSKVLQDYLLTFYESHDTPPVFQHDNAPCLAAMYTSEWLESNDIPVIQWPARSPDHNPIENLWSVLAAKVYEGARQFDYLSDLKEAVTAAWDSITVHEVQKFITSTPRRCIACLKKNCGPTGY